MRTQGINLHVAHHCFFLPSFISSPPSPSLETKNRKRRRIWKRLKTSRRISGERLSIETILQIIDRSVKKKKKKEEKGEKGEENRMHSRVTFVREFLFRESLSTRLFPREIPRERKREKEEKRESLFCGGGEVIYG